METSGEPDQGRDEVHVEQHGDGDVEVNQTPDVQPVEDGQEYADLADGADDTGDDN